MELKEKLAQLPDAPGVYLLKDERGEVLYVGKAKNLRARVRTYFQNADDGRPLCRPLKERTRDVDVVLTATEKEALILENNLIKQFRPRYNVVFRDDKTYASIKVDLNEPWPAPRIVRRRDRKPNVLWFGPYASAQAARSTLRQILSVFPLRQCSLAKCARAARPCIQHEIGRCMAPCSGEVSPEEYRRALDRAVKVLKGDAQELIDALREQMTEAADRLDYERAAELRDRIEDIQHTLEKQRITSASFEDRDVFGFYAEGDEMEVQVMFIRSGRLEDVANYHLSLGLASPEEGFAAFLNQFYARGRFAPRAVLTPVVTPDADALAEWLSERRGAKVAVIRPQRGEKRRLVEMAEANARQAFLARRTAAEQQAGIASALQRQLRLRRPPRRVECFDISNIHGLAAVGAAVSFLDGRPDKSRYRRFRIKTVKKVDDFAMMREVLIRHYAKAVERDELPDLALIDGGKGQLSAAVDALRRVGADSVDVVAIAKARARRGTDDRFFLPGESEPVLLPPGSPEKLLLMRIRDEAHRFAVAYHRKLRAAASAPTPLDDIPGVGPARKVALLRFFGSIGEIRKASPKELTNVRGVSRKLAEEIWRRLHPGQPLPDDQD